MDEVLSVILLKKAGGWEVLGGEREPSLRGGHDGTRKGQTLTGQKVTAVLHVKKQNSVSYPWSPWSMGAAAPP